MLVAIARQLMIVVAVITLVGISALVWPLDEIAPERQLAAAAGSRLCFVQDETVLVGASLEGDHVGDELIMVAAKVPSLQRLSLVDTRVTVRSLQALKALPKLISLNLGRTPWTQEALGTVAEFPMLKELRLEGCDWLRDEHLVELVPMKTLEVLSVADTSISSACLDRLRELPRLKFLILDRCQQISDGSIEDLIRLASGRSLNISLSGTEITPTGLVQLRKALPDCVIHLRPATMVGLRIIGDRGNFVTNDVGEIWGFRRRIDMDGRVYPLYPGDLSILAQLSTLVELNFEQTNLDDGMLQELQKMTRLETLRLSSTQISDEGLAVLKETPNLTALSLLESNLDGEGLAYLSHVPHVANLKIQTRKGDEILHYLRALEDLRMLSVSAPLSDDGAEQLAKLPKLRSLVLMGTNVRAAGIAKLADSPALSELRFDGGHIDDSDVDAIAGLTAVKWVVLSQTSVTTAGRDRLTKLRPDMVVQWIGMVQ